MRPGRPLVALLAVVALVVLVVDQLTKVWAVATFREGERVPLVGDLLGLTLLYNPGAALSLATGMTWVFTLAAIGVSIVVVRIATRLGSRTWAVALGLLLGGAVGNLIDRLVREPGFAVGHVVDFIAYGDLFVGNVADIAIVAAAGLIILLSLRGVAVDGTREGAGGSDVEPAPGGADAGAVVGEPAGPGEPVPDGDAAARREAP
ncbi:signal peptidase (SPase) II [Actinotalea ferrariae CF5-4]|uniref:Lipoprotein signal peptidase n=1 Tax=Actinotalea ferrariae CF5-4 TaxID=948458 RepID=A0A021VUJ2_9CELL|nr:signal peptidase (SPase) II [Actinotalea ferrariae CF5-4]